MNNLLNDVIDFLNENGAASMEDLVDALEVDREDIRDAIRVDGKLDEQLRYSKSTGTFSLR